MDTFRKTPQTVAFFTIVLTTHFFILVKSEERISVDGLVPIDRCTDSWPTTERFGCKIDNCGEWIFFTKCPENDVSTKELNLVTKCLNCKKTNLSSTNDFHQGLFPKSLCDNNVTRGEITWCHYEKCWFPFGGCADDEIPTEYLNFKNNLLVCQKKDATSNPGDYNIVPAPTTLQQTSVPQSHSGQELIQANAIIFLFLLLFVFNL